MNKRQQFPGGKLNIIFCLLILFSIGISCGRKDTSAKEEQEVKGQPAYYQENDTLKISPLPENLSAWFNYYQQMDSAFRPGNFIASGVTIHLDSMEDATTGDLSLMENFFPLFAFSPDGSQIIDFWSYNQLIEINKTGERLVIGGDPDQEVVWINKTTGSKKQLMYNGPQQIIETADWVSNQSFLLSLMNVDETNSIWTPEILLFNLVDTTFTNFRYNKSMSAEKMNLNNTDFSGFWLKSRQYKRG